MHSALDLALEDVEPILNVLVLVRRQPVGPADDNLSTVQSERLGLHPRRRWPNRRVPSGRITDGGDHCGDLTTVTCRRLLGWLTIHCIAWNYPGIRQRGLPPEHLAAYVDEQVWRFNHRDLTDWERFDTAMRLIVGKRLMYEDLTDGAKR